MPHFEIVAHVRRELDCDTAEEAAAVVRRQLLSEAGLADDLLHLAVWREEPHMAASPLPGFVRQQLIDFFAALERCAGEAEESFRERVAAILMAPVGRDDDTGTGASPASHRRASHRT